MSDSTYARIHTVGETSKANETVDENNEEVHELSSQQQSAAAHGTPFTLNSTTRRRSKKLLPRKKARTGKCNNLDETKSDHNDSMITVSNRILDVIQQREERQQREAEKKRRKFEP
ncbi:hypothetical protein V5N11_013269 [Cardamine amara subsp. amara]|uniref:Uncharacterized protein n=1 Tax=Cardamine amara subsp. amara TaxID=228776 RepID=A0ABD0ZNP0_CARAN